MRACGFDEVEGIAWHVRLQASYALDDYVDSGQVVTVIARRWPEALDQIRDRAILDISSQLKKSRENSEIRFAMISALFAANWTNDGQEPNEQWFDYVRLLLKKSDLAHATEVVARIDSPSVVLAMRVDKRFDSIGSSRKGSMDIERAMKCQRDRLSELRIRYPDRLYYIVDELVFDLRDGQVERALATADDVIRRVGEATTPAYPDMDEWYIWILDSRAQALERLGRWDEAVIQLRKAARRPEGGGMNVSQTLNLARVLARLGRVDEAEAAMEDVEGASLYGRMQLAFNRLIVAHVRGDKETVAAQLEIMRTDRSVALSSYQAALVIAGQPDTAAALLIERLRDESWRRSALSSMQSYTEVAQTPLDKAHMTRWREILAREDVRAALDKVGRIEQVPFANPLF